MKDSHRTSPYTLLALLCALAIAGGCSSMPDPEDRYSPPVPAQPDIEPATSGAIYQSGSEVRLFEDLKASRVGDILTVHLIEQTDASKNANTATSKSASADLPNPVIFGRPVTAAGVPILQGSLGSDHSFDGSGSSSQSNSLRGDITVTVTERYPNGNLLVRGEKWVTLNQGKEFIRLSGIVRPYDIEPDNSLLSSKIAEAQITYSSKGVMAAANRMGLFSRFFNSILAPF